MWSHVLNIDLGKLLFPVTLFCACGVMLKYTSGKITFQKMSRPPLQLSHLFNVDDDICGRDIPLTVGVHQSLMTYIYESILESCWSNVKDFQPCTFINNQSGFDKLCKMDNILLLFENKWSDLISTKPFNVNELKAITDPHKRKIKWSEKQTVWVAAAWRSKIPEREECVSEANFGGHVIIKL